MSTNTVDSKKVEIPEVSISPEAIDQLNLIHQNDYTIEGKLFRVFIKGKGCEGFIYDTIFDMPTTNDLKLEFKGIQVLMDPFSAFFLSDFGIDYIFDPINELEGFVVTNHNQDKFTGKFWTKGKVELPPLIKTGLDTLQDSSQTT